MLQIMLEIALPNSSWSSNHSITEGQISHTSDKFAVWSSNFFPDIPWEKIFLVAIFWQDSLGLYFFIS